MPDGYIKGKPHLGWWLDQIRAGERFREDQAFQQKWKIWRKYSRGQWRSGTMPVNVFFTMLRATVPRVYFRDPAVSVRPAIPGYLNMAFAQLLNRIDNKLLRQINMKKVGKRMIHDAWMKGTGFGKLGFGGQYATTPSVGGVTEGPVGKRGELFEYHPFIQSNMPWFMRTDPGHVVLPDQSTCIEDARWIAHRITRPVDDAIRDPRLKNTQELRSVRVEPETLEGGSRIEHRLDTAIMYEVRDRKFRRVFVFSPSQVGSNTCLLDQEFDVLQDRRFPFFELVFNMDPDSFWGLPDAQILEPQQLELNEINTQIMKHRRLSLIKLLYQKGAISETELAKMMSEDVGAGVQVEDLAGIEASQVLQIPQDLIQAKTLVMQDIRDSMGFSRNQMGEFQSRRGDTSATEAEYVQQGSEIRVDERRDILADVVRDVVVEMNEIIFDHWNEDIIVDIVGPGGVPVWVQVNPAMLRHGRYNITVDPDSASARTRPEREQKAFVVYEQLKMNPLIDPVKLTQYLLTEIEGVEMDDLMRMMPPPGAGGLRGVLNPMQLAGMMQQGMGQLQQGAAQAQIPATSGGA